MMKQKQTYRDTRPRMTDELSARRQVKRKKNSLRLAAMITLVLVTISFTVWSIMFILARDHEESRLSFLTSQTVGVPISSSIAILSDSTIVIAPSGGLLLPLVDEGSRVAKEGRYALIVPIEREDDVRRYRELKDTYRARLFAASGFADVNRYPLPLSPGDSLLREAIPAVSRSGGADESLDLKHSMRKLRFAFQRALTDAESFAKPVEELGSFGHECDSLLSSLESDANTRTLRAPVTCQVSFVLASSASAHDAEYWEWIPNPLSAIDQLINDPLIAEVLSYCQVETGQTVATLSKFSEQSVMAFISTDDLGSQSIKKGDRVDLYHRGEALAMKNCLVTRIISEDEIQRVFVTCEALPEHILHRSAMKDVSFIARNVKGLCVPLRSLANVSPDSQTAELMRIAGGVTQTITVNVLGMDERYAVIESQDTETRALSEADLYVVNPWTISDGKLID
ncbi:MAG: hypothetical protein GX850_02975 [Clostridiaceae bacterium]|jgi:hypothetical protein|nr:hypothetical protein [Clostridiaceae bacterium]